MSTTLRLPLAVTPGGSMQAVESGSPVEVAQAVALLLSTTPGERRSVPDYGLPSPLGAGIETDELVAVITEWEPRATPALVEQIASAPEVFLRVYPSATAAPSAAPEDGES